MLENSSGNILGPPHLDFETWKELVRTIGGRFNPEGIEPTAFTGSVRPISVCGLTAAVVGSNAHRVERTLRDVRLDGANHYFALFHVAGRSAMTHNDEAVRFDVGDVVLVDAARPVTFFNSNASEVLEVRGTSFAAPITGFASRIRATRWSLPAQRNDCRAPPP